MTKTFVVRLSSVAIILTACALGQAQHAEYHSVTELKQRFNKLADDARVKNTGSTGADLGSYANHALRLSYRRETGQAEVHVHLADVMVVTAGSATIITGGTLVEAKNENENEIKGKSVEGGTRRVLSEGDIIHISAGTPHQLILDQGKYFQAFVVKIHD